MVEQGLKDKTIKGTLWSAADAFLGYGIRFIVGLVLARLLSPEEYGLIGIVIIFMTILEGFIDCGFSNSLIRRQSVSDDDYSTLFYFNLSTSMLMFSILFVGAPWIAEFFDRPQLIALCRVMGLLLIFQALSIVQYTILSRNVDFKTKTKASIFSAIISGTIGVVMAVMGFGVWSLVAQQLSKQFLFSICLWVLNKWWPKKKFSVDSLKYMWGFGWKIMLSGLLERVWSQLQQSVVGKYYSPYTLGQYTQSNEYASLFSSNLTAIIQRVTFPVLSKVQNDIPRMTAAYRRVIKTTMFVTAVCMISMAAVAEPLIYCLIGEQWRDAAAYLPFLCISMSLYPLHAINLNMLQVQGRTDIFLYLEVIKKTIGIIPVLLGIFVNIYWMLIGGIFTGFISFILNSYYTGIKLGYTSWMQLKDIAPSYGIAIIIATAVYFLKLLPFNYWIILPVQVLTGVIVLFCVCEKTKLSEYLEIKNLAKNAFVKIIENVKRK